MAGERQARPFVNGHDIIPAMPLERFTRPQARLPSALVAASWKHRLDGPDSQIPVFLVHPDRNSGRRVPVVLWMHGRTAEKETDPGRYLRLMRAGIGVCAVDLPGHGERLEERLQLPERTFEVVRRMIDEIDSVVESLGLLGHFDVTRIGIGGMSAGGMAALARLCRPHLFSCVSVEATTGSWFRRPGVPIFRTALAEEVETLDPIQRLDGWRPIPFQAFHTESDEWIDFAGQKAFIDALGRQYDDTVPLELITFERTGAPYEHIGFGRMSAEVKSQQTEFFRRHLLAAGNGA